MGVFSKARSCLTYSNVMATVAVFLAMGGAAYAITVPDNSVGSKQLKARAVTSHKIKRNAVSSPKIKDRSLMAHDFKRGQLPAFTGAQANDTDPAPTYTTTVKTATITTSRSGRIWVVAALRDLFLTCSDGPCSTVWGLYVDGKPVADAGIQLETVAGESDGHAFYTLFGTSPSVRAGRHTVTLGRMDSPHINDTGQLGAQLSALAAS
jgi:hypothetical protein